MSVEDGGISWVCGVGIGNLLAEALVYGSRLMPVYRKPQSTIAKLFVWRLALSYMGLRSYIVGPHSILTNVLVWSTHTCIKKGISIEPRSTISRVLFGVTHVYNKDHDVPSPSC